MNPCIPWTASSQTFPRAKVKRAVLPHPTRYGRKPTFRLPAVPIPHRLRQLQRDATPTFFRIPLIWLPFPMIHRCRGRPPIPSFHPRITMIFPRSVTVVLWCTKHHPHQWGRNLRINHNSSSHMVKHRILRDHRRPPHAKETAATGFPVSTVSVVPVPCNT